MPRDFNTPNPEEGAPDKESDRLGAIGPDVAEGEVDGSLDVAPELTETAPEGGEILDAQGGTAKRFEKVQAQIETVAEGFESFDDLIEQLPEGTMLIAGGDTTEPDLPYHEYERWLKERLRDPFDEEPETEEEFDDVTEEESEESEELDQVQETNVEDYRYDKTHEVFKLSLKGYQRYEDRENQDGLIVVPGIWGIADGVTRSKHSEKTAEGALIGVGRYGREVMEGGELISLETTLTERIGPTLIDRMRNPFYSATTISTARLVEEDETGGTLLIEEVGDSKILRIPGSIDLMEPLPELDFQTEAFEEMRAEPDSIDSFIKGLFKEKKVILDIAPGEKPPEFDEATKRELVRLTHDGNAGLTSAFSSQVFNASSPEGETTARFTLDQKPLVRKVRYEHGDILFGMTDGFFDHVSLYEILSHFQKYEEHQFEEACVELTRLVQRRQRWREPILVKEWPNGTRLIIIEPRLKPDNVTMFAQRMRPNMLRKPQKDFQEVTRMAA